MDFIVIGEVLKPQGIRGELKIAPLTDDAARFRKLRAVYVDSVPHRIVSCRISDYVFLKLEGVDTRNDAEKFVGKQITIDRIHAIVPEQDSFFIVDLLDCKLIDETDEELGVVCDVSNYGSADVITAKDGKGRVFRFPFLKRIYVGIDVNRKVIDVKRQELEAVSVYED